MSSKKAACSLLIRNALEAWAGSLTKTNDLKWLVSTDNFKHRGRTHKSTFLYNSTCFSLNQEQKKKTFKFFFPNENPTWNCINKTCMGSAGASCNYTVLLRTLCTAALVSQDKEEPLLDLNSLSFPSRVPVSSCEEKRKSMTSYYAFIFAHFFSKTVSDITLLFYHLSI